MNKPMKLAVFMGIMLLLVTSVSFSQKIETKDGVRFVHNEKEGQGGQGFVGIC